MSTEILEYVKGCEVCQRNEDVQQHKAGKLVPLPIPGSQWNCVSTDRITHLPMTKRGFTAILVIGNRLTKMTHFAPCHGTDTAEHIADLYVSKVVSAYGVPLEVLTGRDTEFCTKFADAVCKLVGTLYHRTTAYHPRSNDQTERMNRVLETCSCTM